MERDEGRIWGCGEQDLLWPGGKEDCPGGSEPLLFPLLRNMGHSLARPGFSCIDTHFLPRAAAISAHTNGADRDCKGK